MNKVGCVCGIYCETIFLCYKTRVRRRWWRWRRQRGFQGWKQVNDLERPRPTTARGGSNRSPLHPACALRPFCLASGISSIPLDSIFIKDDDSRRIRPQQKVLNIIFLFLAFKLIFTFLNKLVILLICNAQRGTKLRTNATLFW